MSEPTSTMTTNIITPTVVNLSPPESTTGSNQLVPSDLAASALLTSETDVLYNSLKRLSNSTAMSTMRLRRVTPSPIPFKDAPPKELTCTVNQVYYANGKSVPENDYKSEVEEVVGSPRHLYKKKVRVIGTSLKNCVQSDVVSIDIDPESTRLPLMCKLMIIVEGAYCERGTRVLVRDASIQVNTDNDNESYVNKSTNTDNNRLSLESDHHHHRQNHQIAAHSEMSIPVIAIHDQSSSLQNADETLQGIRIPIGYRSLGGSFGSNMHTLTTNTSSSSSHSQRRNIYERHEYIRTHKQTIGKYKSSENINYTVDNRNNLSAGGGSLTNLPSQSLSIFNGENCGDRLRDSYVGLDEYQSIPYYQYQRKSQFKQDFSTNTDSQADSYELHIPIRLDATRQPIHRNEKHILITNNHHQHNHFHHDSIDTFKSIANNMRRYLNERLNRFEAEITFFNLDKENVQHKMTTANYPITYTYHHYRQQRAGHSAPGARGLLAQPSVTNLMLVQVVNGSLNI